MSSAPTWAEINLAALDANLRAIAALLEPEVALLVAVKANAYGHGAVPIARRIEQTQLASWLAVATVGEGIELREAQIGLPILKLSACLPHEWSDAIGADLTLTVIDADTIAQAGAAAARAGRRVPVHLKLDSGMGRIGSPLSQAVPLARLIDAHPQLELEGIFTHLPIADAADDGGYTEAELDRFEQAVAAVEADRGPVRWVHASNSAATLRGNRPRFTMVRTGIISYGLSPDATNPALTSGVELTPVMSLVSTVSFLKQVSAGTSISYGRTWTAPRDTTIATVAVGYGDGFSRANSNRGRVLIGGRSCPVVGRVCMDQTMVDLGPEPTSVRVGDRVTVIGRDGDAQISADELAALADTINYEVVTLITARVPRIGLDPTHESH